MKKILYKIYTILFFLLFPLFVYASDDVDKFRFEQSKIPNVSVNDSYFNLNDYNLVTSIKNQYNTSACWAFATMASIESNLLMNNLGYTDLSEAHLELATQNTYNYGRNTFARNFNTGGNYHIAASYLMNSWGAINEANLPFSKLLSLYNDNINVNNEEVINRKANYDVNSIAFLGSGNRCDYNTIQDIKEYLITNGALASTVYSDNTNVYRKYNYYNGLEREDVNGQTIPANQDINHGVTIVGWDDTISKDYFGTINPPTRDGAFIIKNSYGENMVLGTIYAVKNYLYNNFKNKLNINSLTEITDSRLKLLVSEIYEVSIDDVYFQNNQVYVNIGDKGYEYISYDDIYVCSNVVGFFDVDTLVEDHSYYYDDLGFNAVYSVDANNLYLVSTFEKMSNRNEELNEISMYFPKMGQKYEVYFANGEEYNTKNSIKIGEGESNFVGYNNLKLFKKPIINYEKYTIMINIIDDDKVQLGVSMPIGDSYENLKLVSDYQYISVDGKNYTDVSKLKDNNFQLTLKAYTNETDKESNLIIHNNKINSTSDVLIAEYELDYNNMLIDKIINIWNEYKIIICISLGILLLIIISLIIIKSRKKKSL